MDLRSAPLALMFALVATSMGPIGCGEGEDDPDVPPGEWCEEVADWDTADADFELEVVALVNERRAEGATCGSESFAPASALTLDPALRCAARSHSLDMATRDFFDHVDPDGGTFSDRANSAGYDAFAVGENIAAGQTSPEQVVTGWMGSEGHCRNIMRPETNEIGVGYTTNTDSMWGSYWTQVFGQR